VAQFWLPLDDATAHPIGLGVRAVALRMPYAYLLNQDGTLFVYRIPDRGWSRDREPMAMAPEAGDGSDIAVLGETLYCTRGESLEAYSLADPARPAHLGRFGPKESRGDGAIVASGDRLYLVCPGAVVSYDVSSVARTTRDACAGAIVGGRLYVGAAGEHGGASPGIAVFDISEPDRPTEVAFLPTETTVWRLSGTGGGRLLAGLAAPDGRGVRVGPQGSLALFSLAAPDLPELLMQVPSAGGRSAVLLSTDEGEYCVCDGTLFLVNEDGLTALPSPLPYSIAAGDFPYRGAAAGRCAAVATDGPVSVVELR
jgi:hypothetical protein